MIATHQEGKIFRAPYPFVRDSFDPTYSGEASKASPTWKPGVSFELVSPEGDTDCIANGVGEIILTVISIHKPGRYPSRVFYTRQWRDPDGREFGKPGCRIATMEKFNRLSKGYQYDYDIKAAS